jgi:hypothetical protein
VHISGPLNLKALMKISEQCYLHLSLQNHENELATYASTLILLRMYILQKKIDA